jgi:hypothetical protein
MNAKEKIMKRATIANTFALAAVTALALGIAPMAKADNNKGCSNATLKGTFAHLATGFVTAPPAMAGPLTGVGTDTFDGNGGVTSTATVSINGNIVPLSATGTYKVNPDCTGTYSAGTNLAIVISNSGDEIQAICTEAGIVLTHTFRRQFPVSDWRN